MVQLSFRRPVRRHNQETSNQGGRPMGIRSWTQAVLARLQNRRSGALPRHEREDSFEISRNTQVLMVPGFRMRGGGADLVEITREGDCYYVKLNLADLTDRASDTANRIIRQHYTAAIAALEEYRGRLNRSATSSDVLNKHVEMQHRTCACGKQGLHDFSYAAVNRRGVVLVRYSCIYCGETQSFSLDHSR